MNEVCAPLPRVIVEPTALPIEVDQVLRVLHLRLDDDRDDLLLEEYIRAVAGMLDAPDGLLGIVLSERTFELKLDRFPGGPVRLPVGPVAGDIQIGYLDATGAAQTVPADRFEVDDRLRQGGWIVPVDGYAWPATRAGRQAVTVTWKAGGGCPDPVRQFIRLVVARWHRDREAAGRLVDDLPYELIAPWRAFR